MKIYLDYVFMINFLFDFILDKIFPNKLLKSQKLGSGDLSIVMQVLVFGFAKFKKLYYFIKQKRVA